MKRALLTVLAAFAVLTGASGRTTDATLVVGSKRFTESYILGEIVAEAARPFAKVTHRPGLGNTAVVFEALKSGAIDIYPEYLGTLQAEILKHPHPADLDTIRGELARMGLGVGVALGFANGYALALRAEQARRLGIVRLGDLRAHPGLRLGLSHEFIGRADGWPGLSARYALPQKPVGIDHGIAYEALIAGRIDVMDIYSTDAKIAALDLAVLADDLHYFPRYDAVLLYRLELPTKFPAVWASIQRLQGRITPQRMIAMNADAELRGIPFDRIAKAFVAEQGPHIGLAGKTSGLSPSPRSKARARFVDRLFADDLARLTRQHLTLVVLGVLFAALLGVPIGAAAAAAPKLEQVVMGLVGLLQTIPSLALFAMLIPLLGRIGTLPALVALTLYALLPIVRNTTTGLVQVPHGLRQAGTALGLTPIQRWRSIDLPLAAPVIVAGIKTAAVITVGTATIAAFIGAGGFGERIATGLALNDHAALLAGAVPAAMLALVTQALFELLERVLLRRVRRGA
ncbi:MAG TPA: glycine betaine ABC transporter substrate-binding protein [Burkholderiaceae bacterium]|nr:glycine betaine ABC transporter substrate-binding protein [Burkholderiaceae bacterium]